MTPVDPSWCERSGARAGSRTETVVQEGAAHLSEPQTGAPGRMSGVVLDPKRSTRIEGGSEAQVSTTRGRQLAGPALDRRLAPSTEDTGVLRCVKASLAALAAPRP